LRAQTLGEPMRTESLALLRHYADLGVRIANTVPGSGRQRAAVAASDEVEQDLWRLAGEALDRAPADSAPRVCAESLNESFDDRVIRIASLDNRVPPPVIVIELAGASLALALLGVHLGVIPLPNQGDPRTPSPRPGPASRVHPADAFDRGDAPAFPIKGWPAVGSVERRSRSPGQTPGRQVGSSNLPTRHRTRGSRVS